MRKISLTLISLLGTMAFAPGIAAAQGQPQEQPQAQPQAQEEQGVAEVRVTAPMDERYRLLPDRMGDSRGAYPDVRGSYPLSQGQWLDVGVANHKLVAELNERGRTELMQVGKNKFAAKDQDMTLEFFQGRDGDRIEVTYMPDPGTAATGYATSARPVTVAFNR